LGHYLPDMLDRATFLDVIKNTPLVAIDLVVFNPEGKVLVGLRKNNPAKGWWFTPGGRIRKDETLDDAFARISQQELGVTLKRSDAKLLDIYEHLYPNNVANEDFSTHYVVVGYAITLQEALNPEDFANQHEQAQWLSVTDLLASEYVHENTKAYHR
jgi:colanic acid biosynthesis protein WcaH